MIKILTLKYNCVKCGKPEFITVKNDSLNAKYQLVSKCFDNKICLACYCASEKVITETAENISALMCWQYRGSGENGRRARKRDYCPAVDNAGIMRRKYHPYRFKSCLPQIRLPVSYNRRKFKPIMARCKKIIPSTLI